MEEETFGLVLATVSLIIFALVATLLIFFGKYKTNILKIEKDNQLAMFKATVDAEEKQKRKIAKNLHDEVLTMTTLLAQHIDKHYGEDKTAAELIDQIVGGLQTVSLDLIPKSLTNFGLIKAIEQYAKLLNRDTEIELELENNSEFSGEIPFANSDQLNIYRICLEILNNLKKHVTYTILRITIDAVEDNFIIEFTHNGEGVTNSQIKHFIANSSGLGLRSLESRLLILNADISYSKESDLSTVTLLIPIKYS